MNGMIQTQQNVLEKNYPQKVNIFHSKKTSFIQSKNISKFVLKSRMCV